MEFLESITMFWIMSAAYFAASGADMWMSRNLEYYGLDEGFRLSSDKYGNFNFKPAAIGTVVFWGIAFAVSFATIPGAAYGFLAPVTAGRLFKFIVWTPRKKAKRRQQIAFLNELRPVAHLPQDQLNGIFSQLGNIKGQGGRWYHQLFKYCYTTNGADLNQTAIEVRNEICKRAVLPLEQAFDGN